MQVQRGLWIMATKQSLNSETEEKVKKTTARKTAATNTKAKKTEKW